MNKYIIQNMTKYSDYLHFNKTFKNDYMASFDEKKIKPSFEELYNIKNLMIVAEPGYGKTRLLKQISLKGNENNKKVFFIDSKIIKSSIIEYIEKCKIIDSNLTEEQLQQKSSFCNQEEFTLDENTIICLDALDELVFSNLFSFFEKVKDFISKYPNVKVFISCRTHHLNKIEYDLSNIPFEYITLDKFYGKQIKDYLKSCSLGEKDRAKIEQKSKLTNLFEFLSIPRYLYYFSELIKDKNIDEITDLSRIEMFEHFIYRKINKERDKSTYSESENHTLKRVLEELALVMKIYQVSQISKDEFFTIFKELNLSNIFTGQNLLEKLFDKSVLKDNIDYIEFENQEFLDFLASKELCRFDKLEQVFFDLAVEPHIKEVYTPWFYVLPFILEQHPFMINVILDFLENNFNKTLRKEYFNVITSIDTRFLDEHTKSRIFNLVFDYHTNHNQWFYANKLVHFYNEKEHYQKILDSIKCDIDKNNIKIRNAIEMIEELSSHGLLTNLQLDFWKSRFLEWLNLDKKKYKNLHSAIISSCSIIMRNDFDWIKSIYFIFENGIEVQHEYSRTCNKIAPNDKFSIDIYFKTDVQFKKNQRDRSGRLDNNVKYICKIDTFNGIEYMLEKLNSDNSMEHLNYIFDESSKSKFHDDLKQLTINIKKNITDKNIELIKQLIINLLISARVKYNSNAKYFFSLLFEILVELNQDYIYEFINCIYKLYDDSQLRYHDFEEIVISDLSKYFNKSNFDDIYELLKQFEKNNRTLEYIMCYQLFVDENIDNNIKKNIQIIYKKELLEYEVIKVKREKKWERDAKNRQLGLCKQWKHKIEPEPEKFMTNLFSFYINKKDSLINCKNFEKNKDKTIAWAKIVIKDNNPLTGKVETNGNSSTVWGVHYYKDAINLLTKEQVELDQNLRDNVFRYLPFDINSDYETTLKLANNPSDKAIQDILDVYSGKRDDDLGIYHPDNFIEIYKQTKIKEAEPLLLKMLQNNKIDEYTRRQIIDILPKEVLSKEIIAKYIKDNGKKDVLYEAFLICLIKNYNDKKSINEAFRIIIKKGKTTKIPESEGSLFGTALELNRQNKLALTLIHLDYDIKKDKELLSIAMDLRDNGKYLNGYFFEEIVFRHIKYLNHKQSFQPILEMEKFIQENQSKPSIYAFKYKLNELKEIYLQELAKPKHIMEAVRYYKKSKENEYITVRSPFHLTEIIKESIEKDIRHWIEIEGAYKHIEELAKKVNNTNAEDFIQKTLKPQIELSLIKKGLRSTDIIIKREEQTLDDKRADFTISYGFVGSILLELKLEGNPEAGNGNVGKEYKKKLKKYIGATNSDYGIFLIFNIKKSKVNFDKQIEKLTQLYENEDNILVVGINCKIN